MIFGGLHLAWGTFNLKLGFIGVNLRGGFEINLTYWTFWLISIWFVATCAGGYIATQLIERLTKMKIYVSDVVVR